MKIKCERCSEEDMYRTYREYAMYPPYRMSKESLDTHLHLIGMEKRNGKVVKIPWFNGGE